MKILSVNSTNKTTPARRLASTQRRNEVLQYNRKTDFNSQSVNFKGNRGALIGMAKGAAIGGGIAGIAILSGLMAPILAGGGALAFLLGSAGFGSQIGGIIGGIKEGLDD